MDEGDIRLMVAGGMALVLGTWVAGVWAALQWLSWGKVRKLDAQKDKELIGRAEAWMEDRDQYRLTLRLLALACLAEFAAAIVLLLQSAWPELLTGTGSLVVAAVAATAFTLLTEAVGACWLALDPWRLLSACMPAVTLMSRLALPVVFPLMVLSGRANGRRDDTDQDERATTEDEIMSLVEKDAKEEASDDGGSLEDIERRMIRGIFDLDETLVKEIMTPRVDVDAVPQESSLGAVRAKIIETGHSRIPIYRDSIDDIVGMVYAKDLLDDDKVAECGEARELAHAPVFIPETKNVGVLLEELRQNKIHLAVVIDEYGGTAGIVTIEDILEEIVGEIRDEYDVNEQELLCRQTANGLVVDGRIPVGEINDLLGTAISEEEDYDTIGGYISSELGRIPKAKETVRVDGLQGQVLEADERRITKLRLVRIDSEQEADA